MERGGPSGPTEETWPFGGALKRRLLVELRCMATTRPGHIENTGPPGTWTEGTGRDTGPGPGTRKRHRSRHRLISMRYCRGPDGKRILMVDLRVWVRCFKFSTSAYRIFMLQCFDDVPSIFYRVS